MNRRFEEMEALNSFGLSRYQLMELMSQRRQEAVDRVNEYGGVEGIGKQLETDLKSGISGTAGELETRTTTFGENVIPSIPAKSFIALCWDAIQDKTLLILIVAALLSIILGVTVDKRKDIAWVEGVAILVAVVVVVLVTAINDWTKERQFRGLQKKLDTDSRFSVIRNSQIVELPLAEIVVGDVAQFKYGNTFPVDGVLIQGFDVRVDEACMTGEAELVKKKVGVDPLLFAGSQVMEGGGTMIVTAVGPYSQQGIIFQLMTDREDEAGFITKAVRRCYKKYCTCCKKKKDEEEEPPMPTLQRPGLAGGDNEKLEVHELTFNPDSPVEDLREEDDEDELKGMAKFNLIKRMKRRKEKKKKGKKEEGTNEASTESGSVLQRKLNKLAVRIGYGGTAAAVICVIILSVKFAIQEFGIDRRPWEHSQDFSQLLHFVIIGITVLVVAVPEGLPLAVTIALAYSVKKMLKDSNLVRHLHACETMGNATSICSDKTGTLTTNRMTVVESFFSGIKYDSTPERKELSQDLLEILKINIAVNSGYTSKLIPDTHSEDDTEQKLLDKIKTCFKSKKTEDLLGEGLSKQVGNVTECALLGFLVELDIDYERIREEHPTEIFTKVFTFNSARKSMSTVLPVLGLGHRLYTKGASEIVLKKCSFILKEGGHVVPLTAADHREIVSTVVQSMAGRALRTIALAYRDFPGEKGEEPDWDDEANIVKDLVLLGIVGIQDPVRPEVPSCIRSCQKSGITVRMVTGDNVETARSIALKCGIITPGDGYLVIEGKEFNRKICNANGEVSQEKLDQIWPRLRVLARSSPTDKHTLVDGIIRSRLFKTREVVAVTGDGTNDGPALKRADVGFAMGIAGTDVAKEASDIILTDDNFASIVKAVSWGRNVYDSISKFLQFQLTVNIVAVVLTLISAVTIGDSPLRALQLLWVNLIMDTLASLALATERPTPDLLKRKPYGRKRALISYQMWVFLAGHTLYQLTVLFVLVYAGADLLNIDDDREKDELRAPPGKHFTVVFNTFVFMQLFNEINARKIHGEWNVFSGIHRNIVFLCVVVGQVSVQILIVQVGFFIGIIFNTAPLTIDLWLWCIFLGSVELLIGQLLLFIPVKWIKTVVRSMSVPCKRTKEEVEEEEETDFDPLRDNATRAKVLWMKSLTRLRTQIRVVNAFRQGVESGSMVALAQLQGTPRPVRHNRPVTGIETAV